ncbi:MAG TPA: TadE family protein [Candidatus Binataceae bacterium]|nr:TadE family protein [Candidatus Binataceae bacterium]
MSNRAHSHFPTSARDRERRGTGFRAARGQSSAEFALLVLPCLVLIFGIINFSLALYSYDFVCYSAQQAVRYAIVHGSASSSPANSAAITSYVDGLVDGVLNTNSLTVTTTWSPNNNPGSVVTVQVSYTFTPIASFVSSLSIPMSRTAAMVISQ